MRSLLLAASLLVPAVAHAEPPPPTPRLDVAIGVGLGPVLVDGPQAEVGGVQLGLEASVAYLVNRYLAVVAGAGLWQTGMMCPTDVDCLDRQGAALATVTAGARLYPTRAFYLQAALGISSSARQREAAAMTTVSRLGTVALGWRRWRGSRFVGFELRAMVRRGDDVTAIGGAAVVSVGRSW